MAWHADLMLSGPPLLEKSGALAARLTLTQSSSAASIIATGSTLTYDLLANGVSVLTAPVTATLVESTPGAAFFVAVATPPAALVTGLVYQESWTGTVSTSDGAGGAVSGSATVINLHRDAYAVPYPQRLPPIGTAMIGYAVPSLATAPAGAASWYPQIARAWYEVAMWTIRQRKGALWTPSELVVAVEHLALYYIWRAKSAFGAPSALANMESARTAYALALKDVQLGWDTDGDSDLDTVTGPGGSAASPAIVV